MNWLLLILSLPNGNATARQRIWRALRASGAAVLRDGVYLMPGRAEHRHTLTILASDIQDAGGVAQLLNVTEAEDTHFRELFDRSADYTVLLMEVNKTQEALTGDTLHSTLKRARKLRKTFANLAAIDFFPGEAQRQADAALLALEQECARCLAPDEPHMAEGDVPMLSMADYQGRTWATRRRPWVDRLASAWLIRRLIDPAATLLWLASPADCPPDALGFDFDGAAFSHLGHRVTFEVLASAFGLNTPAIARLGRVVHYLDAGGIQPPEAVGIESILAGLRENILNDDALLEAASTVFDGLLSHYHQGVTKA